MAGIAELYKVASAMQRDKLAADPLDSGVKAFGSGLSGGFESDKSGKDVDRALKMMQLSQKMKEIQQQDENYKLAQTILKAQGIIPLDENEKDIARDVSFDAVSAGDIDPAESVSTEGGKITKLVNNATKAMSGKDGYSVELGGDLMNPKMKIVKTSKAETATDRVRVDNLAAKMAKREYAESVYKEAGGRQNVTFFSDGNNAIKNYVATPDDIAKYRPTAAAYLRGEDPPKQPKKVEKPNGNKDSIDGIGDLSDIDGLWDLLN